MPDEQRPGNEPARRRGQRVQKSGEMDEFWSGIGVDIEGMSPKAQAVTGIVTGGVILLAAATVLIAVPQMWWLIFVFGWAVFPAFGVFARGVAGLIDSKPDRPEMSPANGRERELLGAIKNHGEITPVQAAMETSLTVAEADEMLGGLAEGGHLEVRVRGGGLFYALWDREDTGASGELEGR
ncbi:MAG: hypothetical protein WA990_01010 [Rubrobacteraceae bacterium]